MVSARVLGEGDVAEPERVAELVRDRALQVPADAAARRGAEEEQALGVVDEDVGLDAAAVLLAAVPPDARHGEQPLLERAEGDGVVAVALAAAARAA